MEKTIFITGASSGIGKATALYFAARGWQVVATMRNPAAAASWAAVPRITCLPLDVTEPASVREAVRMALEKHPRIDVLVNNAGYALFSIFENTDREQIARQLATNVTGLMDVTREMLPHFRRQRGGTIINIASVGGKIGFPCYSSYNASKFAVEGFSEALVFELAPLGIKVRLIEPGMIRTDFYTRSMDFGSDRQIEDYANFAKQTKDRLALVSGISIAPQHVARAIYRAAVNRSNRLRYPVGADARLLFFLKRFLPCRFSRWLLGRVLVR